MLPFVTVAPFGPLSVFGVCVAAGVVVGTWLLLALCELRGVDRRLSKSFIVATVVPGFIVGHLGDALLYHWADVVAQPLLLLDPRRGLSSFCGFAGGLAGALWFRRRHGARLFVEQCELLLLCFPVGWCFGRLGCSLVHDHPGVASDVWFAVRAGAGASSSWGPLTFTFGDQPRLDLGLIELVLCIPLAALALRAWKTARLDGATAAVTCLVYGPLRLVLDAWRASDADGGDVRFAHLTPGQWAGLVMFGLGLVLLQRVRRLR